MNRSILKQTLIAILCCSATSATFAQKVSREAVLQLGRQMFEHEWKPGEPASPGGDGLGPNFNDVSCLACHNLGGIGGGGPVEKNVDMISLPPRMRLLSNVQLRRLVDLHPGFFDEDGEIRSSIVLHRFSTKPKYVVLRQQLIGEANHASPHSVVRDLLQRQLSDAPLKRVSAAGFDFVRSQRNTTALFGAAIIDAIPDRVLHQLAEFQAQSNSEISGRVAFTPEGAGHFGWRGGTRRLSDFVLGACGNEVGLRVPGVDQALVPDQPEYQPVGFDMSPAQSAAMIAFVADIPRPYQTSPRNDGHATMIAKGFATFKQIGCVACHVQNPGGVPGVFSDLLLHDMGPGLTDPAPAQPEKVTAQEAMNIAVAAGQAVPEEARPKDDADINVQITQRPASSAYPYGGSTLGVDVQGLIQRGGQSQDLIDLQTTNIYQEWRTPPLWGVQDSAPYLHDGRAETLTEAIVMHGGESAPAAARFIALDYVSRRAVLEFLGTLRSPFIKAD